jgi:hypothetical protein
VNLHHVAANQHVGQSRRGRDLVDVVLRRLHDAVNRVERQRAVEERVGRRRGPRQQLARRHGSEFGAHRVLPQQIATDEPGIGLTHPHERLPRAVMHDRGDVHAAIRYAVTKDGKMNHR